MKIDERPGVVAIVDDDSRDLESLGELLESAGYAVRLFDSAEAFLQAGALAQIDALISDIRMPGVDGVELQRRVAIERPQLPVILITARTGIDLASLPRAGGRGGGRGPGGAGGGRRA